MTGIITTNGVSWPGASTFMADKPLPQAASPISERTKPDTSAVDTPKITTKSMTASEASTPQDLAMEHNPVTTAGPSSANQASYTGKTVASDHLPSRCNADQIASNTSTPAATASEDQAMRNSPVPTEQDSTLNRNIQDTIGGTYALPDRAESEENARSNLLHQEMSATGWLVPAPPVTALKITFDEYLALSEITFEWGDSYDDKDWMRLKAILAPTLMVDYTDVNGYKWDDMPASDFVGIMSHIGFVGDPLVHTQHHLGASKWRKISNEEAVGYHQLRAAHQRYTNADLKTVENKGHGHAMVKHFYRKIDGEWKLSGLRPTVRWNEFEFEKIFKGF